MSVTIAEVAKGCGVAKQTVTKYLIEMGLWDAHVTKEGRAYQVDDHAAALVADAISRAVPRRARGKASEAALGAAREAYEARLSDLRETVAQQREQLRAKDEQIASLTSLLEASRASEARATERMAQMASAGILERLRGFRGLLGSGDLDSK